MEAFKDYYPVESCAEHVRSKFACPKCNHLEMRPKIIKYKPSWTFDHVTIECEKCKCKSTHSL